MPGQSTIAEGRICPIHHRDAQRKPAATDTIASLDRPVPAGVNAAGFGSDVVADALRATGIPYSRSIPAPAIAASTTASSTTSATTQPQMLLCLHEESAVAIAQGYAKVTGKAMAVAVHSNVGLMHATMAIFNAWCDRMPMLILGATGPVDSAHTPSVDRLDPHVRRSGRPHSRLHQMGRPAGLARPRHRSPYCARTGLPTRRRADRLTSTSTPACRR